MGTTMHAHIETKMNGNWEHYATPTVEQNYLLYAAVNGVRNDFAIENIPEIKPQASIQSLPADCTKLTKYCYELDKKSSHIYGEGCLTATASWNTRALRMFASSSGMTTKSKNQRPMIPA